MFPHFETIYWKNGRPRGKNLVHDPKSVNLSYTIIHDPYFKRISIERYREGVFDKTVYDSALFDARHLSEREQLQWMRERVLERGENRVDCLKDGNQRTLFLESQEYERGLPRCCTIHSPHGVFLAKNRLFYEKLGDVWNGVLLEDSEGRPILKKRYALDQEGQFSELLEEIRDFS